MNNEIEELYAEINRADRSTYEGRKAVRSAKSKIAELKLERTRINEEIDRLKAWLDGINTMLDEGIY